MDIVKKLYEVSDEEILKEVRRDPVLLVEIENRILRKRLGKAILEKVEDAVENDVIKASSVDDFIRLIGLDLLLSNSICK